MRIQAKIVVIIMKGLGQIHKKDKVVFNINIS